MKKRILMVAFEFPPSNGASIQRIKSFYEHFIKAGWEVDVLTVDPKAYSNTVPGSEDDLLRSAAGMVMRPIALDVHRHLSFKGKHLGWMATPDRWGMTWIPNALSAAKKRLKTHKPDVIWSTAPIPSTHYIAALLSKKHNIPWVADYRDPMPYLHRPAGAFLNKVHQKIDKRVMIQARHITFATGQIKKCYEAHFPEMNIAARSSVVANGYNEANFSELPEDLTDQNIFKTECFSLYYGGVLYSNGRDPLPVFEALSTLKREHPNRPFELIFQGAGDGLEFTEQLSTLGLTDDVHFLPSTSFKSSLINIMNSDGLVLIQDEKFNNQIPGKLYEYLRSNKNILLKTPLDSATWGVAKTHKGIYQGYCKHSLSLELYDMISENLSSPSQERDVAEHSRDHKAAQLLAICNEQLVDSKE
jgi:glycosyltransferase involved in cell wall biosynthesis